MDRNIKNTAEGIFSNTFSQAQQYNLQMAKTIGTEGVSEGCERWIMHSYYEDHGDWPSGLVASSRRSGFLNEWVDTSIPGGRAMLMFLSFYDDEGWWALGWIAAYDVTGNQRYLQEAEKIFTDMQAVFGKANCSSNSRGTGGIWWDRPKTYVNAIANELHLSVAAHLANRVGTGNYRDIALQQWNWFLGSGMINSDNLINDGLDRNCQNNNGIVWSYNQGVVLGGLAELSRATGDASYINRAQTIADAAIASLAPNGILKDQCEPNCGGDGPQFKGIFARNLMLLHQASPQTRYARFLENNANSIWNNDRNANNELGLVWSGAY